MKRRYRRFKGKTSAALSKRIAASLAPDTPIPKPAKPSKHRNVKVTDADGITHDSQKERDRWVILKLMERQGLIQDLQRQVWFELIPKNAYENNLRYKADFVYEEKGRRVVEDVKGQRTDVYIIKRKLMYHLLGIRILET